MKTNIRFLLVGALIFGLAQAASSQGVKTGLHTVESARAAQLEKERAERLRKAQEEAARLRAENQNRLEKMQKDFAAKNQAAIAQINRDREQRAKNLPTSAEAKAEADLLNAQNTKRQLDQLNDLRLAELEAAKQAKKKGIVAPANPGDLVFNPTTNRYERAKPEGTPKKAEGNKGTELVWNPAKGCYERAVVEE